MNRPKDIPDCTNRTPRLTTHVVTEAVARHRFQQLLEEQHRLGARKAKGRSLYQVICRDDQWVGLILWTGSLWHLKARDQWIGWDALTRSERLQLVVHQARLLVLEETRQPNLASQMLGAAVRELPAQWQELYGYRPLLAETFTDPESHAGTCYKAAGWEPLGLSGRDGRHYAEKLPQVLRPKKLWIKTLHPQAKSLLCQRELAAPYQAGLAAHAGERCAVRSQQLSSLFEALQRVPDPRSRSARRYPIGAVLTLVALGLLRGAVHVSTILRTAQKLSQSQRAQLRLPFKKGTRFRNVPGYDVFRQVLNRLELEALARVLTQWLQSHAGELPRTLAVDGKTIRDHLGLIVTLVDAEEGTPVALAAHPAGKGHELKTTQTLLASPEVSLLNATVTADSLHCQDETAHIITREKGGDYLLQVRDNQPTLHQHAHKQLAQAHPLFAKMTPGTDAASAGN
ncbi:MAG: ISAs1 family transposase [Acidobacteriota bacterium]